MYHSICLAVCFFQVLCVYAMEMNLSPQVTLVTLAETDGGAYYTWSDSKTHGGGAHYTSSDSQTTPVLGQAKLGAGKLVLHPRGFAFPHYVDGYKVGFVTQGRCRVGIVLPNSDTEHVLTIKKGDVLPIYLGAVTWWYNAENTDTEVIFMGDTSKTYTPTQFDYFLLTGALGVLGGFSTEFVSQAFNLSKNESEKLVKSQSSAVIVKLGKGQDNLPEPSNSEASKRMAYNLENAKPFFQMNHGGSMTIADAEKVHLLKGFGLSPSLVKVEANSMLGPFATSDSSSQVFYLLEGSGRVQVSGLGGKNVLDAKLKKGDLFVVPRFFAAAIMADGKGLQCFSVLKSSVPSFMKFAGEKSVWKAISPSVLQAAFNVDLDLVKLLRSKI